MNQLMPYGGLAAWSAGEVRTVSFWLAFSEALLAVGIPYTASRQPDWQWFDGLLLLFLACQRCWMLAASLLPPIRKQAQERPIMDGHTAICTACREYRQSHA